MIVLDTHVLIWMASEPAKLSPAASLAIASSPKVAVSAISCWEVTMLVERGRLALDRDVNLWLRQVTVDLEVVAIDCRIAALAGALSRDGLPGDPADRLIWATTDSLGTSLVTADRALREYSPAGTIW